MERVLTTVKNPFLWNQQSHTIFLYQPVGTGFLISLEWTGAKGYRAAPDEPWTGGGKQAGELKLYENCRFYAFLRLVI